jgi:hypothetical protein
MTGFEPAELTGPPGSPKKGRDGLVRGLRTADVQELPLPKPSRPLTKSFLPGNSALKPGGLFDVAAAPTRAPIVAHARQVRRRKLRARRAPRHALSGPLAAERGQGWVGRPGAHQAVGRWSRCSCWMSSTVAVYCMMPAATAAATHSFSAQCSRFQPRYAFQPEMCPAVQAAAWIWSGSGRGQVGGHWCSVSGRSRPGGLVCSARYMVRSRWLLGRASRTGRGRG